MITEGELGGTHAPNPAQYSPVQPGYSPSLDPDSETFITWQIA